MADEKNTPEYTDGTAPDAFAPAPDDTRVTDDAADALREDRDPDVSYDSVAEAFAALTDGPDAVDESAPAQYGVGPFSVREVALGAIWVVAFIVSFFPIYTVPVAGSVWTSGIDWILTIGIPTIAVFLVGLRRLSPQGIRRVGSLGVDQFASVAFTVSTVIWLGILWSSFVAFGARGAFYASWVVWVEFILMLAGVMLTVFAPLFPTIGDDFRHRSEVPAHRFARPARPVVARPAVERPVTVPVTSPAETAGPIDDEAPAAAWVATDVVDVVDETVPAQTARDEVAAPPASQAFWALAPVERDVVDETGAPLFVVGPTAWALVIEDRGDTYVVRHEDGRVGYLTDVSGVTRG